MAGLSDLEARRAHDLRLTPDRALATPEEAVAFLRDRGMLTLMADCSLPSLFGACHEEPYAPGSRGFGRWPKTKWWWGGELKRAAGVYWLRIRRGRGLFVTDETIRLAAPLCLGELERAEVGGHGPAAARLVAHLGEAGPSLLEELAEELAIEVGAVRRRLERVGAIVARDVVRESHRHTSELLRFDQLGVAAGPGGLEELVAAGVRAAVAAPEEEARRWFSWPLPAAAADRLVVEGRLRRVDGHLAAA